MTAKVIYSECSMPFWLDVAVDLAHNNGWEPCYWTGDPQYETVVKEQFPWALFHNNYHAVRSIPASECSDLKLPPVDQEILHQLAYEESIVLSMMNRMDPSFSFSHPERLRLYHRHLRYWRAVLDHLKPDIFITPVSPHLVYDYVLYTLCRRRGIKTVMFKQVPPLEMIFPVENVQADSLAIIHSYQKKLSLYREGDEVDLSPASEKHLDSIMGSYDEAVPLYMQRQFSSKNRLLHFARYRYYLSRAYEIAFGPRSQRSYLKKRGQKIEESTIKGLEFLIYKVVKGNWIIKQRLSRHYDSLTSDIDFEVPYVYVALNYQPERTTSPEGGVFVNQLLMVDLLSKALPFGWSLYVKEHPSQFLPSTSGSHSSRSKTFYDDLAALPNVKLVSLSLSPFQLIDKAKAVATVTGTVGWEALLRGKPVLCFGYAWYKNCEGVFYTPTVESCESVMKKIGVGYEVEHEKVRLFIQTLEQKCARAYLNSYWAERTGLSREQNAKIIARTIHNFVIES